MLQDYGATLASLMNGIGWPSSKLTTAVVQVRVGKIMRLH
jgi:hypothetical protein